MLLKIDFEKVYDMVQWDFMEKMLNARDFGDKWVYWVMSSLRSRHSQVLVIGEKGKLFKCKRGLR